MNFKNRIGVLGRMLLFVLVFLGLENSGFSYDWINSNGGDWTTASNWNPAEVPNGAGTEVTFSSTATDAITVNVSGTQTVGSMAWSGLWQLNGGTINLQSGNNTGVSLSVNANSSIRMESVVTASTNENITVSGGGELTIVDASGVTGNWIVANATLATTNTSSTQNKLGTGNIILRDGGILKAGYTADNQWANKNILSDIQVEGNASITCGPDYYCRLVLYGDITGSAGTSITKDGGWPVELRGNNSGFAGNWYLKGDQLQISDANSLGTGTVYYQGAHLLVHKDYAANAIIANDLVISSNVTQYLVGIDQSSSIDSKVTLTGKISGSKNIAINGSTSRVTVTETALQGDNTGFSGNWTINNTIDRGDSRNDPPIVSTDNSNHSKISDADSRFGSGSISLGNGILKAAAANTYIHNNIALLDNLVTNPFQFDGKVLTLTGDLTGSADITLENNTSPGSSASRLRLLDGDHSGFSGDWHLKNTYLVTNAGNVRGKALGTGTIYLEGGAGLVGWSSNSTVSSHNSDTRVSAYIYNDIVVSGTNYLRSDGDTIDDTSTIPNHQVFLGGDISGDGLLIREGGGYKWDIRGNNTQYTGDWLIKSDYLETNNTPTTDGNQPGTDIRFGTGTIYMDGGGIQGSSGAVFSNITVNGGKIGYFRNTSFELSGLVSVDGTLKSTSNLTFRNQLQGTGIIQAPVILESGAILSPGSLGVTNFDGTPVDNVPVGTLTFEGSFTLKPGSTIALDFASVESSDRIILTSDTEMSLDGVMLELNFLEDFDFSKLSYGDSWEVMSGATFGSNALPSLSYDWNVLAQAYEDARLMALIQGNSLYVKAVNAADVPEPSSYFLLLGGLLLGGFFIRKKSTNR